MLRDHLDVYAPIYFIFTAVFILIGACFIGSVWSEQLKADALKQLGYETRIVNLDCYAKYQGRWLDCKAVATNQIQLVK